jgi:c-di-GMP-binding flagellar brake protein YcgR
MKGVVWLLDFSSELPNTNMLANLIDSRTVVEKKQYVTTGVLSHIEGDLIEIQVSPPDAFKLGDPVKLTIYSPIGMYTFISSVIAHDHESIVVVNPPEHQRKFPERREHYRVEVNCQGYIQEVGFGLTQLKAVADNQPIEMQIQNVSLGGIGVRLTEGKIELMEQTILRMEIVLGISIPCVGKVARIEHLEDDITYGIQLVEIDAARMNTLRAFVLREQVSQRFQWKGQERARKFK